MKNGIAIAGTIVADVVKTIDEFPAKGMLTSIRSVSPAVGGCVPNTLIDLAKIDPNVPLYAYGSVGDDDYATFVATEMAKGVQEAVLDYRVLNRTEEMTKVQIRLCTGRTHQIRVQFASRGWPLVGERKYSELNDPCEIALWSCRLAFTHPKTGEKMEFFYLPPQEYPWTEV